MRAGIAVTGRWPATHTREGSPKVEVLFRYKSVLFHQAGEEKDVDCHMRSELNSSRVKNANH